MAQLRGRTSHARARGFWDGDNESGNRRDPIFDFILSQYDPETPGVFNALEAIEDMRAWGVKVTPAIAQKCLFAHMHRSSEQNRYNARRENRLLARRHPPIVYYMKLGDLVKIGFTENLTTRLEAIRPEEVLTTEPGGREREAERHKQFADLRVHGEWFRLEGALVEHIEAVKREAAGE